MKVFVVLALAFAYVSASTLREGEQRAIHPKDKPKSSIEGRITNGYPAYEGKVPYIVGLSLNSNGNYWWCGGSIIGHTWVVTAAHCTSGADAVIIYYGATWQTQPQYTHHLSSSDIIRHPDYVGNDHDISLIRTPHVDFWALVDKVELPSMNDRYNSYADWWALASGWGAVYDGSNTVEYLNCLDAQIIPNSECQAYYGYETVTDNVICIRAPDGKSTCQGDSGGPLVTHDGNRLVGITSFVSIYGCQSGAPAGFTRVTSYLDWIRDTTGISY